MTKALILSLAMGVMTASVMRSATDDNVRGFYWIDSGSPVAFTVSPSEIDASGINDGFHVLNMVAINGKGVCSTPESAMFIKVPDSNSYLNGTLYLDGNLLSTVRLQNIGSGTYACDADMGNIAPGVHNLQLLPYTDSGTVSEVIDTWFLRIPTDAELSATKVAYFIDGAYVGQEELRQSGTVFLSDIDTQSLKSGIHSIDISLVLPDGTMSSFEHGWFYRTPIPNGIIAYDYWFDDDYSNTKPVVLEHEVSDFSLVTMIDIPELPFDSRNYEFSILDGKPSVKERHTLNMRFFESDGRAISKKSVFTETRDTQSVENIEPLCDGINHVTTKTNEIKWYKFDGEVGDSIMICSNSPSMFELYSPLGKELIKKSGSQAQEHNSLTLLESGTYYFAAHNVDIKSSSDFDVTFHHIPRNAILEVTPSVMTSSGTFALVELFGNGMLNARTLILDNGDGTIYETSEFAAYDNYHLSATITLDKPIPTGKYDVTLVIDDPVTNTEQRITKPEAITVLEAGEHSDIVVEVVPSKKASTPYMVDIRVTNDSDAPCWGVPVNVACERDGGKNGFVFYMSDFLGEPMTAGHIRWYESDNILGTGTDGLLFPLRLSYMHPHETRILQVGIIAEPHKRVGLYAWAGTPFNEEAAQLMAMPRDSLNAMPIYYTNLFNLKTAAYILQAIEEIKESAPQQVKARAAEDDNIVLESLREYGPDAIGRYKPLERPTGYADQVGKLAENYGNTEAGIVNSGAGYHCYNYFKNEEHIPGATLAEQVANIDLMYGGLEGIPPGSLQIYYMQAKKTLGRGTSPEDIAVDTFGPDWLQAACFFNRRNADSSEPMPTRHEIDVMMSGDPNMITGYSDPSGSNYVGLDVKELDYTIEFENDPEIANAPASTIVVTNKLDNSVFDLESFMPKNVKIGAHTIDLPAEKSFVKTVDMRPEIQCIAEIRLDFSTATGEAVWRFSSLDPLTMMPVEDYRQGLLPVNDETGVGMGFISYSVKLKDGIAHSTTFSNSASIMFDTNEPIATDPWYNITDYERPEAKIVKEYGYDGSVYSFDVETTDDGSGVMAYNLYARTGYNGTWTIVLGNQTESHIEFATPEAIDGLQFMVRATDCAGNRQISDDKESSVESIEVSNGETGSTDDEQWYDLRGIRLNPGDRPSTPTVIISTKGRKTVIR